HYSLEFRQIVGNVASEPAKYAFEVRSHWYNSPTALGIYSFVALLLVVAVAFFVYFWIQSFRRVFRQNELKRQSGNLGQIAMLVEQGKTLVSSGDDTMFTEGLVKFDKVSELITPIVNNGPYLGEQRLLAGLDLLQVQSSLQAKIKVNFETVIGNVKLDPQLERDIYAVVYHGLHNAVHHSEGSEINVFVHKLRSKVHVHIEDDGIGIPLRSRLHFGEGLYKMSDVAKSYKTKFKLKSSRKGTKIQIVFPLIERDRMSKEELQKQALGRV
ncbi:sensor histidine kinase, partial [Pseudoalteromonas luteoviolacea]|uniref:sensor histidine kinase n=1 Tax=Pseudoalteromonas luteoviolacea TaxID=43657 RepID=UPI001B782554